MLIKVAGRIGLLIVALIVGTGLGFGGAYVLENGWLEPWRPAAAPPEEIVSIRQINGSEVWVETRSGTLYHNPSADTCESNCWSSVAAVPEQPEHSPEVRQVFADTCVRPPPLLGVVERRAECQREDWVDFNTVYARRGNGALAVWRFTSGGEWVALTYLLLMILGAVGLFALALAALILQGVFVWLSRRAGERRRAG